MPSGYIASGYWILFKATHQIGVKYVAIRSNIPIPAKIWCFFILNDLLIILNKPETSLNK